MSFQHFKHSQPPPPPPPPPPPFGLGYETSPTTNTTTFVHADPSTFRAIVQHLTGSSSSSSTAATAAFAANGSHQQPPSSCNLHERRQQALIAMRKLEMIKLHGPHGPKYSSSGLSLVSPVSTLDGPLDGLGRGFVSPREDEEQRAIVGEKGLYSNLHPNLISTHNNNNHNNYQSDYCEPRLLPLFPLHSPSPRDHHSG